MIKSDKASLDVPLAIASVEKDFTKPPVYLKKKKKKTVFVSARKKKKRKPESDIVKYSRLLAKKKITERNAIDAFLADKGIEVSSAQLNVYELITNNKYANGNLLVNDNLANNPIYFYFRVSNAEVQTLSNDYLFLRSFFYNELLDDYTADSDLAKVLDSVEIKSVHFASNPFVCKGDIKRGYYQDFEPDFAAIGVEELKETEQEAILNFDGPEKSSFKYNNLTFEATGDIKSCIIVSQEKKDGVKEYFDKMKIIHGGAKLVLDARVVRSNESVKYIDCKVKPDKFCPAFLISPVPVNAAVLFKCSYDYNTLFNYLADITNGKDKVLKLDNIMYWDTLQQSCDLLGLLSLTGVLENPNIVKNYKAIYENYVELKSVLNEWKINQLALQRLLFDFYNAFNNFINYDKLLSLLERTNRYLEARADLMADETAKEVNDFFNNASVFCTMIHNQLTKEKIKKLPEAIQKVLFSIKTGKTYEDLIPHIRQIGVAIYECSEMNEKTDEVAFPFIVSPGGFLGAIKDNRIKDPLVGVLTDLQNEKKTAEENKAKALSNAITLIDKIPKYVQDMFRRLVESTFKDKGVPLIKVNADYVISQLMDWYNNDVNARTALNKEAADNISRGVPSNSVVVTNKDAINKVLGFVTQLQVLKTQEEEKLAKLKAEKNQNEMVYNQLMSNLATNIVFNEDMLKNDTKGKEIYVPQYEAMDIGEGLYA